MPSFAQLLCVLFTTVVFSAPSYAAEGKPPQLATDAAGYAPAATCLGCHGEQAKAWKNSDHDWAMHEATPSRVLGNFANARFDEAGVKAKFFRKGSKFFVNTEGADGKPADFEIRYTFGYQPLQQYLVEFPGGRLQSLTIAWDSRDKSAGGQRWFSLYPGQRFAPNDPLHWTGRYQNWNAMCADCHSTNLLNHYDDKTDTFATTWHEQNVGCQACHGPGQAHVDWASKDKDAAGKTYASAKDVGLQVDFKALGSTGLVEQCAYCHSRRQSLGVGQQPGKPLLDAVLPATLRPDLYHADGQILGEVYEYDSFTQSKMSAAGVACTDCHDPHTTKVKIEGNGLCQQCHSETPPSRFPSLQEKNYDSPEHHHHQAGSAGAQCVSCHMPEKTYMVVDPRRDHSFRLPRPDLAEKTASPDACTTCHEGKTPAWAAKAIEGWYGKPQRPPHYGESFHAVRQGSADSLQLLSGLIGDMGKSATVRATAAERLNGLGAPALPTLEKALKDPSPLVRAYSAQAFTDLPPVERVKHLLPLLDDPQRAVRDEALRALAGIPLIALPEDRRASFTAALDDYEQRLRSNASLPGNRLNLAVLLERKGQQLEALEQYRQALKLDPYFSPARVNLVTLANGMLRQDEAEQTLRDGVALKAMPAGDRGNLAYMLALLLVERGQAEEGAQFLQEAAELLPDNPRIRYNQGLLLLQLQRRDEARSALESGLAQAPQDADLLYAMVYLHGSAGEQDKAIEYVKRLEQAAPGDSRLAQLKQQLGLR
ncbi:tetratricopeptide repeat protein [Aquipseudomonas ullengensis]|uniref:tetratricopeptide repeat protein n=1 Tax=Aquipseudomonas ullengensis TaxID=2759166 RepID=UPI0038B233BF